MMMIDWVIIINFINVFVIIRNIQPPYKSWQDMDGYPNKGSKTQQTSGGIHLEDDFECLQMCTLSTHMYMYLI